MKNLVFIRQFLVFNARAGRGFCGFWSGLALAAALTGWGAAAQAQTTVAVSLNSSVLPGHVGYGRSYTAPIGDVTAGTTLDVTWTFTNTAPQAVILLPNRSGSATRIVLGPSTSLRLLSEDVPGSDLVPPVGAYPIDPAHLGPVTLPPGGAMTVTFKAEVTAATSKAQATLAYSVGGVYDQVWVDEDSLVNCGAWDDEEILASAPTLAGSTEDVLKGVQPDCRYTLGDTVFTNDLPFAVKVRYEGYAGSGWMANYIGGAVEDWEGDITLEPGESSAPFTVLFGMPWYIGNESRGLPPGGFAFTWSVAPLTPITPVTTGATLPGAAPAIAVPALGAWALGLLALGLAGIGARRVREVRV